MVLMPGQIDARKHKKQDGIDPALLKKGDVFRGKNWKGGKNHIFKEVITTDVKQQMLVASECNYWFDPFEIHEPSNNETDNCSRCFKGVIKNV
jgi:hypothetical protein